jgi:hypothetical protein
MWLPTAATLLQPFQRNTERVKSWLSLCRSAHGKDCNQTAPLTDFRLIDCDTLEVVDGTSMMSWVTLSYVWAIAHDSHDNPKHMEMASQNVVDYQARFLVLSLTRLKFQRPLVTTIFGLIDIASIKTTQNMSKVRLARWIKYFVDRT